MARRIPENRFEQLVHQATEVFIARGYRLTQMSEVADEVGVAKGTLYGYVESKDALLATCLQLADYPGPIVVPPHLPLRTLPAGELPKLILAAFAERVAQPALAEALERERADDPEAELRQVVGELYDLMGANRRSIKILDRCVDHPELADLWQQLGREQIRKTIVRYVESRVAAGQFRPIPNVRLGARMLVEICATWAIHIHWDRAPEAFDPDEARSNAIEFIVRGLMG